MGRRVRGLVGTFLLTKDERERVNVMLSKISDSLGEHDLGAAPMLTLAEDIIYLVLSICMGESGVSRSDCVYTMDEMVKNIGAKLASKDSTVN